MLRALVVQELEHLVVAFAQQVGRLVREALAVVAAAIQLAARGLDEQRHLGGEEPRSGRGVISGGGHGAARREKTEEAREANDIFVFGGEISQVSRQPPGAGVVPRARENERGKRTLVPLTSHSAWSGFRRSPLRLRRGGGASGGEVSRAALRKLGIVRTHVAGIRDPRVEPRAPAGAGRTSPGRPRKPRRPRGETPPRAPRGTRRHASSPSRRVWPRDALCLFGAGKLEWPSRRPSHEYSGAGLGFVLNASKARRPTLHGRARRPSRPPRRFRARIATREASTSDPSAAAFPRHPGAPPLKAPHAEVRPASQTSRRARWLTSPTP